MDHTTRRRVLAASGLLGLGATALGRLAFAQEGDAPAKGARVRKDLATLSANDDDVTAFRTAVVKMRKSGAWAEQTRLHADMSQLHHSSWRFLPWHRLQVLHMEKIVAKLSGKDDFAMPYWDWTDDKLPPLFVNDAVFAVKGRECDPDSSIAAFAKDNETELTDRSMNDFGTFFGKPRLASQPTDSVAGKQHFSGSAEWSGHNLIHNFVGGEMGDLSTSPNDPLFWPHHANVDRLWWKWAERHGVGEYIEAWSTESLKGYVDPDGRPSAPVVAAQTTDIDALGYSYFLPPPMVGAAPGGGRRGGHHATKPPRIVNYTFAMQRLGPGKGVIDIPAEAAGAFSAKAVGYLKIDPDPTHGSTVRIRCTDMNDGRVVFDDKMFLVAMGMKMDLQGYRIDLSRVWDGTGAKGLKLEAETTHLVGRKSGPQPPLLAAFQVDASAMFPG